MRIEITWNKIGVILTVLMTGGGLLFGAFRGALFANTIVETPEKQRETSEELHALEDSCKTNFQMLTWHSKHQDEQLIIISQKLDTLTPSVPTYQPTRGQDQNNNKKDN